jgi:ribonuclease HI
LKYVKVSHKVSKLIMDGEKSSTWRINDEKNISVDDAIGIIDKVDPKDPSSWQIIGTGHVNSVIQKRLSDVHSDDLGPGETFDSRQEMMKTFRKYYGPDISERTTLKIINFDFTAQKPEPLDHVQDKNITNLTEVKMYADGGSRGNPGPSASGYVLLTMDDVVVFQGGNYLGITTNNQAEYNGLKMGLDEAALRGAKIVHVYMDSLLVVNQMKGIYRVKNQDLAPVHQAIKASLNRFQKVTFNHVPRELNKLADGMVNETLDAA